MPSKRWGPSSAVTGRHPQSLSHIIWAASLRLWPDRQVLGSFVISCSILIRTGFSVRSRSLGTGYRFSPGIEELEIPKSREITAKISGVEPLEV
jgi:hypothetical protein